MSGTLAYLLITHILSDLVRNPSGAVATQTTKAEEDSVCTSIVVARALRYGVLKSSSAKLAECAELIFPLWRFYPWAHPPTANTLPCAAVSRPRGKLIDPNELMIAAHARALDLTVLTGNVRESLRVPGLKVEHRLERG